ncbi:MAG: hypothetical protein KIB00_17270 [Paeniclostridium sordellii]|uniref:HTH domain-containing protein n=1 Tax=Paraclostridium sordellii TaxID=1505 RepID=UPI00030223D4|nr:HTH domain-containing protein [Paeniclostridium sordellii]MBS6025827.1 hypothetical protein [Paeniclostridium sordellii]CEK35717.1 hypothetical protein UMC2_26101 [[Clostridium] sordellii] [Paeniclostridium sordellii]
MDEVKIDGDYIEKLLNRLVNDYRMDWKLLSNILGVEANKLKNYKKYQRELFKDFNNWVCWTNKALMLDFISSDSADFRLKAYLKLLVDEYGINPESIAKFSKVNKSDVIKILNGYTDEISTEIKYNISSCIIKLVDIVKS